ncbi:MAG: hypothetical protein LC104_02160 [Bacteroidales bacterium]|nr:hypothetical protein [Bacteroidales bacterium]
MRRMVRLTFGMAAFFVASIALAQTTSEFYPLKKDTKWVYKVGDTTIEVKVTEVTKEGAAKLDTIVNGKTVASEMVEVKPDGVYRTKINTATIEPPVKFLQLKDGKPVAKGANWTVDSKIQQQPVKGKFTITNDKDKAKVPAGEFEAIVVDGPDFEIAGTKTSVKYWFAKDKGIVKLSYSIGGNEAVLELKEFTAGK